MPSYWNIAKCWPMFFKKMSYDNVFSYFDKLDRQIWINALSISSKLYPKHASFLCVLNCNAIEQCFQELLLELHTSRPKKAPLLSKQNEAADFSGPASVAPSSFLLMPRWHKAMALWIGVRNLFPCWARGSGLQRRISAEWIKTWEDTNTSNLIYITIRNYMKLLRYWETMHNMKNIINIWENMK